MTRQISMTTRKELIEALRLRYCSAAYTDRVKILDEFVALTCYHRTVLFRCHEPGPRHLQVGVVSGHVENGGNIVFRALALRARVLRTVLHASVNVGWSPMAHGQRHGQIPCQGAGAN